MLIGICSLLTVMGILSIYSASLFNGDFLNLKKQIIFFIVGLFLMFVFSLVDWRGFRDDTFLVLTLYSLSVALLLGLFMFGKIIKGARAWYRIGILSLDPIEFLKIVLIILLAKYFSSRHIELYNIKHIIISGIYIFIPSILIFIQPNMGSVLVLVSFWLGILVVSGIRLRYLLALLLIMVLIVFLGWGSFLKSYQRERIIAFLFPSSDPMGMGWSQTQSKIAVGSGGTWGKGFKSGTQTQYGFLTFPQTDFIFSVIAEEFGFIGVLLLLGLISVIFWRTIKIAFRAKSNFQRLFAVGFATLFFIEVFLHIGVNLGLLPVIGTPLPFVSYGGSNLISKFIALGILQSLNCYQ